MKLNRLLPVLAGLCACAGLLTGRASAQFLLYDNIPAVLPPTPTDPVAAINNAFAGQVGTNVITALQADDVNIGTLPAGVTNTITKFDFVVTNINVPVSPSDPNISPGAGISDITVRPRVRFWTSDGSAPASLFASVDAPAQFLPAPTDGRYSSALVSLDLSLLGGITIPQDATAIWVGIFFDDADGTLAPPGATIDQRQRLLNNAGLLLSSPVNAGSSADLIWGNDSPGPFDDPNNPPPGGTLDSGALGLGFPANFAFRLTLATVPEPGTAALLLIAALPSAVLMARQRPRRRKAANRETTDVF